MRIFAVIVIGLLQKANAELLKVKLHAKSKIASLTSQSKKAAADTAEPVYCICAQLFLKCFIITAHSFSQKCFAKFHVTIKFHGLLRENNINSAA